MNISRLLFICLCISLTSCAPFSPKKLAEPSSLTVDNAMASIGKGFYKLSTELRGIDTSKPFDSKNPEQTQEELKLGLWPCKVTAVLNVTATAAQGGQLVVDVTAKAPVQVVDASLTTKVDQKNESTASRGNTITVELYSPACIPEKTVGYNSPEKVKTLTDALKEGLPNAPFRNRIDK